MARSERFEQAAEILLAISTVSSLRGGWVAFEPDLTARGWYEDDVRADEAGARGPRARVPDETECLDDESTARGYARASLAQAIVYKVEILPPLVECLREAGDVERAERLEREIAGYEEALAPPRADVVELRAAGAA